METQHSDKLSCSEFIERVVASLDGALSEEEEKEMLAQIADHDCCLERVNIARCYKTFLAEKLERKRVDSSVIESIKARIAAEQGA